MSLTILRVFTGLAMLFLHGLPKIGRFDFLLTHFPDPLGLGPPLSVCLVIFAEVVGSILLALGVYVRLACVPLIVTMMVAVFIVHSGDDMSVIELPLFYLIVYVTLLIGGGGRLSLQRYLPTSLSKYRVIQWMTSDPSHR